jgi:hypothetical protein
VAIGIAEACEVQSLYGDMATVGLDSSDALEVRVVAAIAVLHKGDSAAKQEMRPLALGTAGPDPNDDLKGVGLKCTWPNSLSAIELFEALTPEKNPHRIGTYRTFLGPEIAEHIRQADMPHALSWAAERSGAPDDRLNPLAEIADAIAAKALDYLDETQVSQALADTIRAWMTRAFDATRSDKSKFGAGLAENEARRRQLLGGVIRLSAGATFELLHLYWGTLILKDDFSWLLHRLRDSHFANEQRAIVELIRRMYDDRDSDQTDALMETCRENELLAHEFSWLINPVIFGSPEAGEMKAHWDRLNERNSRREQPPLLDPPPERRIDALLQRFSDGDLDAFWHLNRDLTLDPDSTRYGDEYEPDLTKLPGWKRADDLTRDRIVETAKHYLTTYDPPPGETYVKTSTFPWAALAGYRALRLLLSPQGDFVEALPQACWQKWAAIIIAYPIIGDAIHNPDHQRLTKLAYEHAPAKVLSALTDLIEKDNEQHGMLFALSRAEPIWDGTLASTIVVKLNDPALKPSVFGTILSELLEHKCFEARAIAARIVSSPVPAEGEQRERAVQAAQALIRNTDDAGWGVVWPVIENDSNFGVEVFTGIAHALDAFSATSVTKLTDDQLAELYIWIVKRVPYGEDDIRATGSGLVSPAQSFAHWRDAVLARLKGRGTVQACEGIRRAMIQFPNLSWLRWHLQEAEHLTRRRSWRPLFPKELLALTASSDHRLVQNSAQLLEILMESLQRLETELQGETAGAYGLWDEIRKNCHRPKEEMRLSDHVKLHFERDIRSRGIVVNREVLIRQFSGNNPGEKIDIHVDAVSQRPGGDYDRISVIIEVKGCWNRDLMTGMQTQLRDRYLRDNPCRFGLYLVGWFMCPQWDKGDYRNGDTPRLSLDDARARFDLQAATLSSDEAHLKAFVLNAALR